MLDITKPNSESLQRETDASPTADIELSSLSKTDSSTNLISSLSPATSSRHDQVSESNQPTRRKEAGKFQPPFASLTESDGRNFHAINVGRYDELGLWMPNILHGDRSRWRRHLSKRSVALLVNILVVSLVFACNLAFFIWAHHGYPSPNGISTVHEGDCKVVESLSNWLHLAINILSTVMLGASNYCMQLQVAPTPREVDKAHERGIWLDIGIPSVRNLSYISRRRRAIWAMFALTSLPIHLMYNSVFFTSVPSVDYTVAVVSPHFVQGGLWNLDQAADRGLGDIGAAWIRSDFTVDLSPRNLPGFTATETIQWMQGNVTAGIYDRADVSDCIDAYATYWNVNGNLLLVTKTGDNFLALNDTVLLYVAVPPKYNNWARYQWAGVTNKGTTIIPTDRFGQKLSSKIPKPDPWYVGPPNNTYQIDHCLMQPPATDKDRCRVQYSSRILALVCALNFSKLCLMAIVWWWSHRDLSDPLKMPLNTLGDAISSFLERPDYTTRRMCLADSAHFRKLSRSPQALISGMSWKQGPQKWNPRQRRWKESVSRRRWVSFMVLDLLVLSVAVGPVLAAIISLNARVHVSLSVLRNLGFGILTPYTFITSVTPRFGTTGLISNVLLANTPQLLISIVYVYYNGILTCYMVQREFSSMHSRSKRQPLRVSVPQGVQRSSHTISLPVLYGLPYYVGSGLLHWLCSRSLFLARVTAFYPEGGEDFQSSFSTCGSSPLAALLAIAWAPISISYLIALGFRKYDGEMPMGASCSAVISAACHVSPEDTDAAYLPIQWGVVSVEGSLGHCAFTTATDMKSLDENDPPPSGMRFS